MSAFTLVHTSDWHLGRSLFGRKRYEDFDAFLQWLADYLEESPADALLVSGDVFDSGTPGNRALRQYYRFLSRVAGTACRYLIITGGNHDSPTLLDAPRHILEHLDVTVMGAARGRPEDEVAPLLRSDGTVMAIICAVPYLRDRDVRLARPGEDADARNRRLLEGIRRHYEAACERAEEIRRQADPQAPVIAMGHLFTAGGRTEQEDGVRELYAGALSHFPPHFFPENIDYLALGHLHACQQVSDYPHYWYSGAPLPLSFQAAATEKCILRVTFSGRRCDVARVPVPCNRPLKSVRGDLDTIVRQLETLRQNDISAWIEIIHDGEASSREVVLRVESVIENSKLEVVRIRNLKKVQGILDAMHPGESLDDLTELDVFRRRLDKEDISGTRRADLESAFIEILQQVREMDTHAE